MKWLKNLISARPISTVIAALIFAWILLSPRVSPWLYSKKLFLPGHQRGSVKTLNEYRKYPNREVDFTAPDGSKLRGWLFTNSTTDFVYLLHPGNSGDIPRYLALADLLLESGASVFVYEPRGFGESGGKATIKHWYEDGESAFDVLTQKLGFSPDRVVLFGVSLGATAATHVMTVRPSRAIILQSGFSSLERIAKENLKVLRIYPSFMFPSQRMDNVALLQQPHPPLLLVHGLKDTIIAASHTRTMYGAASNPRYAVYLPNSNHTSVADADRDRYIQTLAMFLRSL